MKLGLRNTKENSLKYEAAIYQILEGEKEFPKFYWFGTEGDCYVLVIELLGHIILI